LACHPEAAETPRDLTSASVAHKPSFVTAASRNSAIAPCRSEELRARDVGSFTVYAVQDDKRLCDMRASLTIASPRLVIPRQRRRRGTSHSHLWHTSHRSSPPPVDVGSFTVYAVQDDKRRRRIVVPTSNPAAHTAFVVEIFLSELSLEIAFLARDDDAIDEDEADWQGEQHPRGINQNCQAERQ
jgi:hypothetical protein